MLAKVFILCFKLHKLSHFCLDFQPRTSVDLQTSFWRTKNRHWKLLRHFIPLHRSFESKTLSRCRCWRTLSSKHAKKKELVFIYACLAGSLNVFAFFPSIIKKKFIFSFKLVWLFCAVRFAFPHSFFHVKTKENRRKRKMGKWKMWLGSLHLSRGVALLRKTNQHVTKSSTTLRADWFTIHALQHTFSSAITHDVRLSPRLNSFFSHFSIFFLSSRFKIPHTSF